MLKGIDVSNWQGSINFAGNDFVIMKASEGVNFKDKMLDKHYNNVVASHIKCYGFYHYARPDLGNTPESEADYFLSLVGHHAGKCIFVLDWEQESLKYSPDWALRWLRRVYQKTDVRPLIYLQASQEWTGKYQNIINENYGLWVAHWGVKKPDVRNWGVWALWQFTDTPLDTNYFNGDVNAWFKYCGATENTPQSNVIKKGDKVKVTTRYDYNAVKNASWVLDEVFEVLYEPSNNRVVIGRNGQITGAWDITNVMKV